jgi:glycosyltransferase involved in cell wall biosynthesis
MLRGEEGGQSPELERLVHWLAEVRPEVVHLSNCLLLGTARRIRRELGIPLVCSLQDEDTWIDAMGGAARAQAWQLLRERAADVDLFTPVSGYYARFMAERLGLPPERLPVVPIGIDVEGFPAPRGEPIHRPTRPPAIGFLAHVSESMGAGLLAEAFLRLAGGAAGDRFPGLELRFMGGSTAGDAPVLRAIRRSCARHGLHHRLKVHRSFTRLERIRFLSSLSVVSVPVPGGEAFGTFQLEAMAAGVPVVQPRLGGFPEVVEATGGGVLYEPNTPEALAAALGTLLADPSRARALGRAGREAVLARYTAAHMAAGLERVFAKAAARRLTR